MRLAIILSVSFLVCCCNNDEFDSKLITQIGYCLNEFPIEETDKYCNTSLIGQNCELIEIDIKKLATKHKSNFIDFCHESNSEIHFKDFEGNIIVSEIQNKFYRNGICPVIANINSPDC